MILQFAYCFPEAEQRGEEELLMADSRAREPGFQCRLCPLVTV